MANIKFTGERVVIGDMKNYISTLQEHIARYNFALQLALNKKVLDAACGTGYGANLLKEAASNVAGVDIDEETVKYASQAFPDLSFQQADLNKEFPDGTFDLCVSFETIEHLSNPDMFLTNVTRKCSEFLFSIPVNNPSKYHKQVWNKDEIINMMNKYWPKVDWYNQTGLTICRGNNNSTFMIGYATK